MRHVLAFHVFSIVSQILWPTKETGWVPYLNNAIRNSRPEMFCEKAISHNLQENTCAWVLFQQSCRPYSCSINKKILTQIFFCGFWEIFQSSYFVEYVWATASFWCYASLQRNFVAISMNCNQFFEFFQQLGVRIFVYKSLKSYLRS